MRMVRLYSFDNLHANVLHIMLCLHFDTMHCDRYFVAFSFDTTLGVSIAIIFHKAAVKWAKQVAARQSPDDMSWQKALAECGSYGKLSATNTLKVVLSCCHAL